MRATCPAHLILLDFITVTISGEEFDHSFELFARYSFHRHVFMFLLSSALKKETQMNEAAGHSLRQVG
jgi:hypothetical protein